MWEKSSFVVGSSVLICLMLAVANGLAQSTHTWNGNGALDNWSDGANWTGGAPNGNDIINFDGTGVTVNRDLTVNGYRIFFNAGAGAFTLVGNSMSFFDFGGNDPEIRNNSGSAQTINFNITGDNSGTGDPFQLGAASGDLTFGGTFNNNGSPMRVYSSAGNSITFNNVISGSGKLWLDGYSIVKLNAVNNYTGNTEIDTGEIWIGDNGDISSSSAIFVGNGGETADTAKFFLADLDGGLTFDNNMTVNAGNGLVGNRTVGGLNTSGENTFSGTISRNSDGNNIGLTLYSAGGTVTFGGNITGDDSVLIDANGAGVIKYTSAKTYSGNTFVLDGELRLDGNYLPTAVSVGETSGSDDAALTLGVSGITEDAAITVRSGNSGVMTLGGRHTTGISTFSGGVTLQKATTLTQYDAGGTINFSGQFSGNQALSVSGPGTVRLSGSGANDFSSVSIQSGTLELNKSTTVAAIDANVTIGNGGVLKNLVTHQISDTASVTIQSGGTWDLNSNSETVDNFSLAAGGSLSMGTAQLIVNDGSGTHAGQLSGSIGSSFVKKGSGTMTFTGDNSAMNGNWFVVGGVAEYNHNNAAGAGTINLGETSGSDNARIAIGANGVAVANNIVVRSGSSGTKTIDQSVGSGSVSFGGSITLNDDVRVTVGSSETLTLGGAVSGSGKIIKDQNGTLVLAGNSTYTGNTEIDAGTLNVSGDLTGSFVYLGSGANAFDATLQLSGSGSTLGGMQVNVSSGSGGRTINVTAGTHTMSGSAMTVNRVTTINASGGSLDIAHNVNLNGITEAAGNELTVDASGGSVILSGATAITMTGAQDLGVTGSGNTTISGAISVSSGSSQVNKSGSGTLTLSGNNSGSSFMLNIAGGTVALNHANALGNTAFVNSDKINFTSSGTLLANANAGSSTLDIQVGSGQTAVLSVSGANTFSVDTLRNISGSGTFTKTGSGTLQIVGNTTYTGTFNQNAGITDVQNNLNASAGINVSGGTLNVDGTVNDVNVTSGTVSGSGSINGNYVQNSGVLSPGNSPGTLFVGGDAAWNGGSYLWEINDLAGSAGVDPGWDLVDITGALTIGVGYTVSVDDLNALAGWDSESNYSWLIASADGGISGFNNLGLTVGSFNQNPYGGTFALNQVGNEIYLDYTGAPLGGGGDPSAVPEPNALSLTMLTGLLALSFRHHMLRARRAAAISA